MAANLRIKHLAVESLAPHVRNARTLAMLLKLKDLRRAKTGT